MNRPAVSILIPCYNEERYLAETLESVFSQEYQDFEVIACDDASTDGTKRVLKKYEQKMRIISNERNMGVSFTRNRLLEESRGEFVHFQDADDLLSAKFLTYMLPWLRDEGFNIVVCQVDNFYNDNIADIRDGFPVRPAFTGEPAFQHVVDIAGHAINSLYRKRVLVEIGGFDESLNCAEDFDLHIRLGETGERFAVIGQSLAYHRIRDVPRTFTNSELLKNAYESLNRAVRRNENKVFWEDGLFRQRLAQRFWHMARMLSEMGEEGAAVSAYRSAVNAQRSRKCIAGYRTIYCIFVRLLGFKAAEYLRCRLGKSRKHWAKLM